MLIVIPADVSASSLLDSLLPVLISGLQKHNRRADEALSGVLRERALTPAEATDVLLSVSAGLEALHVHGLVHGCLSPEQVLAVGDAIQLPITCIRQAGRDPETPLLNPKYLAPESLDKEGD